jgi:ABC-2 type transport system permease protein
VAELGIEPPRRGLRGTVALYLRLQLVHLRASVEYRGDFWIGVAGATFYQLSYLIFLTVFFSHVDQIAGWTLWQVAMLFGLAGLPRGLVEMLGDGSWTLKHMVNTGTFDRVLVRPLSPALQTISSMGGIHGLGQAIPGLVLLILGALLGGVTWTPGLLLFVIITILSSTVLLGALTLMANLVCFWEPSARSQIPIMYLMLVDFAKFPLDIFNRVIQVLVTVIAPFAFVSYFPALVLLDKPTSWQWLGYLSPLVTIAVVAAVARLWVVALRRYQGVGH